ncbi:MAG: CDP-diacylglycerol--glycerol-3-phosphate 3-phosphatidyltransferase [Bacilli bacterium]|nr:CDP-diacylglycerol--glycerol-3-phosphate 3-phosphatidyltransferase [Mollicutes bacterium]MDY3898822.1 CDP-diacylglycerol--glycerol-3-phosphate 3-phosphatidyltransferase [Bacilli bacterium]
MNLPNKLTIFRILLIPIIMIVYGIRAWRTPIFEGMDALTISNFIILILIFIGSITDFLDGKIARKYNLVTNFGKFLDPIADKLLVVTGFVILMDQSNTYGNRLFSWWMLAIILAREFIISGMRLIAVENNKVIAASMWGKVKTTIQFITLIYLFLGIAHSSKQSGYILYDTIGLILIYATLVATIFSGWDYLAKNKDVLSENVNNKKKNSKKN